jgi:hypothetical protein
VNTPTKALVAVAAAACLFFSATPAPALAEAYAVPMYRVYNPYSGEHFYTADENEKAHLVSVGWTDEGIGWAAPGLPTSTPVYRLYSGTDHHYTTDLAECDYLESVGWTYEGVGWYSDDAEGVALYRQYNPYVDPSASRNNSGSHNYTADTTENDALVAAGWKAEGVAWYGRDVAGRTWVAATYREEPVLEWMWTRAKSIYTCKTCWTSYDTYEEAEGCRTYNDTNHDPEDGFCGADGVRITTFMGSDGGNNLAYREIYMGERYVVSTPAYWE